MTYAEAIQFLYRLRFFGAKFGLENTRKLAELSGNPQDKLRFIHVAGTNGKGSTCAMIESIYRAAGLRVGLFTSPHLVSFRERIQIDRKLISESDVVRSVNEIQPLLGKFSKEHHPTFFEVVTVIALRYFAELKCDLVIWETGLGGRLDATNIVTPLASVITNTDFDHQQWLGDTLEKIAAEKAGIIKPNIPVITAAESEGLVVIKQTAKAQDAPLTRVTKNHEGVALLGGHQRLNAALAVTTVSVLQKQIPVSDEQIRAGLAQVDWLGRLQLVQRPSGQKVLLDGAHNIASAETLQTALRETFPNETLALVLGIFQDKDWQAMCKIFATLSSKIFLVPVNSERTASPEALAEACRRQNPAADVCVCSSLAEALKKTEREQFVVITGSLYLVGEAMELLGLADSAGERGLNEWTGRAKIYEIWIGDLLIGTVTNIDTDMPSVGGDFQATNAFSHFKSDFDAELSLLKPGTDDAWLILMEDLTRKGLKIRKSNGIEMRFSIPTERKNNGFAYLHIKDGKAWWRPT